MRKLLNINSLKTLPATIAIVCAVVVASSCNEEKKNIVDDIKDVGETPSMFTSNVETFISDSGVTRYRITAPIWNVYDEAKVPRWTFPQGLFLEQFDNNFRQNSKVNCDSATYFSKKRLWRLDGNVVMVNVKRDSFMTRQLFWDQYARRIYSDTAFIRIVSKDRVIEGYGFSSNEHMTNYSIKRPTAIFSAANLRSNSQASDSLGIQPATPDSQQVATSAPVTTVTTTSSRAKAPKRDNLKLATGANQNAIFD